MMIEIPNHVSLKINRYLVEIATVNRLISDHPALFRDDIYDLMAIFAIRKAWLSYCQDRGLNYQTQLTHLENMSERIAFLTLLAKANENAQNRISNAIQLVQQISGEPIAQETDAALQIVDNLHTQFQNTRRTVKNISTKSGPAAAIYTAVKANRISESLNPDTLQATAYSPCWALNLLSVANSQAFGFDVLSVPFPALFNRQMFRADCHPDMMADLIINSIEKSAAATAETMFYIIDLERKAYSLYPAQRRNSKFTDAALYIAAFDGLNLNEISRLFSISKPGALKLMSTLQNKRLVAGGAGSNLKYHVTYQIKRHSD
ncbi:MAG: hypothetical protein HC843_04410 [Sphingomonadales bacterium]|nr:hypothetical protein [Sphingomonadales bacterium]